MALFMISVAAELAGMHPQTLRMYERRGLVPAAALVEEHAPVFTGRHGALRRIQQLMAAAVSTWPAWSGCWRWRSR